MHIDIHRNGCSLCWHMFKRPELQNIMWIICVCVCVCRCILVFLINTHCLCAFWSIFFRFVPILFVLVMARYLYLYSYTSMKLFYSFFNNETKIMEKNQQQKPVSFSIIHCIKIYYERKKKLYAKKKECTTNKIATEAVWGINSTKMAPVNNIQCEWY